MMATLSAAEAKAFFGYNPETGLFTRDGRVVGSRDSHGYLQVRAKGKLWLAHRVAWLLETGEWPDGQIDHINGNRWDNRRENLRLVSASENQRNAKRRSTNTSGVMGVSYCRTYEKWLARIHDGEKRRHLGYFATREEAIAAREHAQNALGYHANHGRAA